MDMEKHPMKTSTASMLLAAILLAGAAWAEKPNGLVILHTDYGADSVYVGEIKGAIYEKSLQVRVDSITNSIPPFDVLTGSFMLAEASKLYPKGTVFCCIVDPGVGSARRPIALETDAGYFYVGPDNGLLTIVAQQQGVKEVRECTNHAYWREGGISSTFHGRDIFGPISASLASGRSYEDVGPIITDMIKLDIPRCTIKDGAITGAIYRVDDYGNMVSNITEEDMAQAGLKRDGLLDVTIGKAHFTAPYKNTYSDVEKSGKLAMVQSSGHIEFAVNLGDLVKEIGEGVEAPVTLKKAEGK